MSVPKFPASVRMADVKTQKEVLDVFVRQDTPWIKPKASA